MARPFQRFGTVALLTVVLLAGATPAFAGPAGSFVNKVKAERSAKGLEPVQVYWDLSDDAKTHAKNMMEAGRVYGNPNIGSATTGWKALAEVVGVGPSVSTLFSAFLNSSAQANTIRGPYNYIGVGVAEDDENGVIWVSMIFMRGPDGLVDPPTQTTTTLASPSTTSPVTTTSTSPAAVTTSTEAPGGSGGSGGGSGGSGGGSGSGSSSNGGPEAAAALAADGGEAATTTQELTDGGADTEAVTATAVPAALFVSDPGDALTGGAAPAGDGSGTLFGSWVVFGLIGLVTAGLAMLAIPKRAQTAPATPTWRGATIAMMACKTCRHPFDHHALALCPGCGKAH